MKVKGTESPNLVQKTLFFLPKARIERLLLESFI